MTRRRSQLWIILNWTPYFNRPFKIIWCCSLVAKFALFWCQASLVTSCMWPDLLLIANPMIRHEDIFRPVIHPHILKWRSLFSCWMCGWVCMTVSNMADPSRHQNLFRTVVSSERCDSLNVGHSFQRLCLLWLPVSLSTIPLCDSQVFLRICKSMWPLQTYTDKYWRFSDLQRRDGSKCHRSIWLNSRVDTENNINVILGQIHAPDLQMSCQGLIPVNLQCFKSCISTSCEQW